MVSSETTLLKSRKNTLATLKSSAHAVPSTATRRNPSSPAAIPTGSGVQPSSTQKPESSTSPGITW